MTGSCMTATKEDGSYNGGSICETDNHSSFKAGAADRSGFPSLTISHYNGAVTYSAEGFLDRNLDAITVTPISSLCFKVLVVQLWIGHRAYFGTKSVRIRIVLACQVPLKNPFNETRSKKKILSMKKYTRW